MEKQEKREKKILTENRLFTVNKREVSFEGLVTQFKNGEDGIYNLITNDKHTIFQPKNSITKQDIEDIPELAQLREAIAMWEQRLKTATGRDAYIIKRTLIELRKDQYIIKQSYRRPIVPTKLIHPKMASALDDNVTIDQEGNITYSEASLCNAKVCETILCNYSRLKEDSWGYFENDLWYFINDFERICDKALEPYPLYLQLVIYKIDGLQNAEIQAKLQEEFGIKYSIEYISSLWRNKIPKLIADAAQDDYLNWYFTIEEKGKYKQCSRCGAIKLANNRYFSKNKTSKDNYYSICKKCRNRKNVPGQNKLIQYP